MPRVRELPERTELMVEEARRSCAVDAGVHLLAGDVGVEHAGQQHQGRMDRQGKTGGPLDGGPSFGRHGHGGIDDREYRRWIGHLEALHRPGDSPDSPTRRKCRR